MQISTKFTIAIHILAATEIFGDQYKITSDFLASSVGCNPVIIRNLMKQLKGAGLIAVRRGPGGVRVTKPLEQITFYDVLDGQLREIQKQFEADLRQHNVGEVVTDLKKEIAG